ncbi:hypothetical protein B0H34DRAFT_736682 [Crassisporium funariophilum]|nr:hypothetical protein B0H34DRAFT_736667 [Crassisporium funariophilum]KAF8148709.1 hypothetical protein B0H34DRAFT_736682 [Crassisporium funariophilum]
MRAPSHQSTRMETAAGFMLFGGFITLVPYFLLHYLDNGLDAYKYFLGLNRKALIKMNSENAGEDVVDGVESRKVVDEVKDDMMVAAVVADVVERNVLESEACTIANAVDVEEVAELASFVVDELVGVEIKTLPVICEDVKSVAVEEVQSVATIEVSLVAIDLESLIMAVEEPTAIGKSMILEESAVVEEEGLPVIVERAMSYNVVEENVIPDVVEVETSTVANAEQASAVPLGKQLIENVLANDEITIVEASQHQDSSSEYMPSMLMAVAETFISDVFFENFDDVEEGVPVADVSISSTSAEEIALLLADLQNLVCDFVPL